MQPATTSPRRFTESFLGKAAALLLSVLWIASMTMEDSHVYTMAPYVTALLPIVVLWALGLLLGYKTVRLRPLSWLALAAGGYFLVRCHMSYSVVESWADSSLILGCFVFYIAGVYAGQGGGSRWIMYTLAAALVLNIASAWYAYSEGPIPWTLRAQCGVCGPTAENIALFTYKNFAGFFLMTAGLLPLCHAACSRGIRWRGVAMVLLGLGAVALSFKMGTRTVWILAPVLLAFMWLLRFCSCMAENRRPGLLLILTGIGLFVGGAIAAYDFLFEHTLTSQIMRIDTHLRTMAWKLANHVAPDGGWFGFGARAAQWETVQGFNEWCTPNMVHNEYLQAWVDYGVVGLGLMLGLILLHFAAGMRQLCAEGIEPGRRAKTGMALTFLLAASLYAICDFGWHQAALCAATAFCCGILASPYPSRPIRWSSLWRNWAPESRPIRPVRAAGIPARLLLLAGGIALAWNLAEVARNTGPAWLASWDYDEMVHNNAPDAQRLTLLEMVHASYPDSRLIDHYILYPLPKGKKRDILETMLRRTLEANPRQVFMSILLADVLGRRGAFEEAERILRNAYDGDGTDACRTNSWPFFYAYNLVRWGQHKMMTGDMATARSMLEYGLAVAKNNSRYPNTAYRSGPKPWENPATRKTYNSVLKCAKSDLQLLKDIDVEPDHSWQQPLEPGGKPALYSRWNPASK